MLRTRHPLVTLLAFLAAASFVQAQIEPDATPWSKRREHWAWQPLQEHAPPSDGHPVDAFVDARLEREGLPIAPAAAPHQQLRRLWYDLVGLPPDPKVVQRFLADPSDDAWNAQVEQLLASNHFGERWARHWLDLMRYAETLGHEFDYELPNAWRYRDYVIRAFQQDLPYDQFVLEHIAGDLLPEPRRDADGNNESVLATGSWWFVEQTHSPVDVMQHQADRIDNQIDVFGKAFLGMTVACARCHDHKFDAISAKDYYGLFGFVQSSRYVQAPTQQLQPGSKPYQQALQQQRELAKAWQPAATAATAAGITDRDDDVVIADARDPDSRWFFTNDAFSEHAWRGPFCAHPDAEKPELVVLPGPFWSSGIAGSKREGTIATRSFPIEHRYLHVRVAGRESRVKVIVDGFHVVRNPLYGSLHKHIDNPAAHWVRFDLQNWIGHTAFVTAIDQRAPDLGDPHRDRRTYGEDGWIAVQCVLSSPHGAPPDTAALPLAIPHENVQDKQAVTAALAELRDAQRALPIYPTAPAMADHTGIDSYVYLRGDHKRRGDDVPRRFLSALVHGDRTPPALADAASSGRRQLADAVLGEDNPLVSRVLVNRVWHHLFGSGLVKSVDNFGALGNEPTHPQLLDWLAGDFRSNGWSVKNVIRTIVTSRAYRRSSRRLPDAAERDPNNRFLHRQNVRPLQAESVRDSLLAISGRLNPERFGPSIEQPKEEIEDARGKPKRFGPRDGDGRRSIYLAVRRNFLNQMLGAFDMPTPFATVGRRNNSNVPAQALALCNNAFVHDECVRFAQRVLTHSGERNERLQFAYLLVFGRMPREADLQRCNAFLDASPMDNDEQRRTAWQDLLHGLLLTTEFRFLR